MTTVYNLKVYNYVHMLECNRETVNINYHILLKSDVCRRILVYLPSSEYKRVSRGKFLYN